MLLGEGPDLYRVFGGDEEGARSVPCEGGGAFFVVAEVLFLVVFESLYIL